MGNGGAYNLYRFAQIALNFQQNILLKYRYSFFQNFSEGTNASLPNSAHAYGPVGSIAYSTCCGSRACLSPSLPLPLSLSLYSVAHIVNKQYVPRAARYDEPLSILSPFPWC